MDNLKKIFNNLYFLFFVNGILLASLFYFKMQSDFEDDLFACINRNISCQLKPGDTADSMAIKSLHTCYLLMHCRANIFSNDAGGSAITNMLTPVTVDLMTTRRACGSYSAFLARLLVNEG